MSRRGRVWRPRQAGYGEHGAVAAVVAILALCLMTSAAMAVDIASQSHSKQTLHDTLDAAAQGGAFDLPDTGAARASALAFAASNDPSLATDPPGVDFWCVVAAVDAGDGTFAPDTTQIPATCDPGSLAGYQCSEELCAIPCPPATDACNTIRVYQGREVPFVFAPAAGIDHGSTGTLVSVACKGSCGQVAPSPMNVVVVADRTGSMGDDDVASMVGGIESMLAAMDPTQQYVALGTIGRSAGTGHSTAACDASAQGLSWPSGSRTSGDWVPVQFSGDYLAGGAPNPGSDLVKAVECLVHHSGTGTALASPMKAAARYLLGLDPNNLGSLPARPGDPRDVIIFETDGQPNESGTTGATSLADAGDVFSSDGGVACNNLQSVAAQAKAAGITVITIAYNLSGATCGGGGEFVTQALAASASGTSAADNSCQTATEQAAENGDGDFFFCAASGSDMAEVFTGALSQASTGIKLLKMPGS